MWVKVAVIKLDFIIICKTSICHWHSSYFEGRRGLHRDWPRSSCAISVDNTDCSHCGLPRNFEDFQLQMRELNNRILAYSYSLRAVSCGVDGERREGGVMLGRWLARSVRIGPMAMEGSKVDDTYRWEKVGGFGWTKNKDSFAIWPIFLNIFRALQ